MRRLVAGLAVVVGLLTTACSAGAATSDVATLDGPAQQACSDLRAVIQARSAGGLAVPDLRARLSKVYSEASASANPILRARAVALFTDATEIAIGGEGRTLAADLAAMEKECSAGGS